MPLYRPCTTRYFHHCAVVLLLVLLMMRCSSSENNCNQLEGFETCLDRINGFVESVPEITSSCISSKTELYPMGSPGSLTCPVDTGVSVNIVQWDYYKSSDGAVIEAINERPRFSSPTNRLEISAVQPEDEGLYVCQVSENDAPATPRVAGCIVVYGTMELVSSDSEDVTAIANANITLNADLVFLNSGGCGVRPRLTLVQLQHNSNDIRLSCQSEVHCEDAEGGVYYDPLGNVTIVDASSDDAGDYRFGAEVSCPTQIVRTKDFSVTVTDAPPNTDIPIMSSSAGPTVSPTLLPTASTGKSDDTVAIVTSVVVVVLLLLIGGLLLLFAGAFWYHQKTRRRELFEKDHVYDHVKTPTGLNGSSHMHGHIDRDDNEIYNAPSTIIGDRNSMLAQFEDVTLQDRVTDQEGSI